MRGSEHPGRGKSMCKVLNPERPGASQGLGEADSAEGSRLRTCGAAGEVWSGRSRHLRRVTLADRGTIAVEEPAGSC